MEDGRAGIDDRGGGDMAGMGWAGVLAAATLALAGAGWAFGTAAAPPDASGDPCELARVDRAHTPPSRCVTCHDGTVGPAVSFQMRSDRGPGFDHPVGVDYGSAAARDPRLVPPALLPRELVLVDGRIACTTCHDGASTAPGHAANPRPDLCTACHRM